MEVLAALVPLFGIVMLIFVVSDAKRRGMSSAGWGILTFFTGPIGLVAYLLARPAEAVHPSARNRDQPSQVTSPGRSINTSSPWLTGIPNGTPPEAVEARSILAENVVPATIRQKRDNALQYLCQNCGMVIMTGRIHKRGPVTQLGVATLIKARGGKFFIPDAESTSWDTFSGKGMKALDPLPTRIATPTIAFSPESIERCPHCGVLIKQLSNDDREWCHTLIKIHVPNEPFPKVLDRTAEYHTVECAFCCGGGNNRRDDGQCTVCNGLGKIRKATPYGVCPDCEGNGGDQSGDDRDPCKRCSGTGLIAQEGLATY